ncbi:Rieske (2Fe-2S) protein [Candidatus Magnetomonas plexicatena]|uniref:Rieske (2Fe-2S) protein n=1 Tax=Candidatus Magnetomonas plexicatena TaxID=2552947 RepID=UPI0011020BAE|nr:Rieske (2Fe-2S) protein [Nitrospirales bacterium LBB_01]
MLRVNIDKLDKNGMTGIDDDGHSILVVRVDNNYFALGDVCPHKKCRLHTGALKGSTVICPCHGAAFDVTTGKLQAWFKNVSSDLIKLIARIGIMNVKAYKCTVSGNEIVIET